MYYFEWATWRRYKPQVIDLSSVIYSQASSHQGFRSAHITWVRVFLLSSSSFWFAFTVEGCGWRWQTTQHTELTTAFGNNVRLRNRQLKHRTHTFFPVCEQRKGEWGCCVDEWQFCGQTPPREHWPVCQTYPQVEKPPGHSAKEEAS